MSKTLQVITLPEFLKQTKKLLSDSDVEDLAHYIALHPTKGDVIQGTGGARKLRWSFQGKGKRGGLRVIYYYYVMGSNIYLITAYTKNKQSDLSSGDKKAIKRLIELLNKEQINEQ